MCLKFLEFYELRNMLPKFLVEVGEMINKRNTNMIILKNVITRGRNDIIMEICLKYYMLVELGIV